MPVSALRADAQAPGRALGEGGLDRLPGSCVIASGVRADSRTSDIRSDR